MSLHVSDHYQPSQKVKRPYPPTCVPRALAACVPDFRVRHVAFCCSFVPKRQFLLVAFGGVGVDVHVERLPGHCLVDGKDVIGYGLEVRCRVVRLGDETPVRHAYNGGGKEEVKEEVKEEGQGGGGQLTVQTYVSRPYTNSKYDNTCSTHTRVFIRYTLTALSLPFSSPLIHTRVSFSSRLFLPKRTIASRFEGIRHRVKTLRDLTQQGETRRELPERVGGRHGGADDGDVHAVWYDTVGAGGPRHIDVGAALYDKRLSTKEGNQREWVRW